jgi:DNA polymerase III epsilon subunit-like protein
VSIPQPDIALRERDLCFIDTETTGSRMGFHEIIEVAAVRTSPDGRIDRGNWSTKIRPEFPARITPFAQQLNGFRLEDWSGAPESSPALWQSFAEFVCGCVPVCHNPSFDRAFISLAAERQGVTDLRLDYHWIGVESLAWPLYRMGLIRKLSLVEVCRFARVPPEPAKHGALNGANTCREVYLYLMSCLLDDATARLATESTR